MSNKRHLNESCIIEGYLSGKSCESLGVEYDCCFNTVRNVLLRNSVRIRTLSEARRSKRSTAISEEQRQIIEGLLLGDASIFRRRCTACFRMKSVQKEFTDSVMKILPFSFNYYNEPACTRSIKGKNCSCKEVHIIESPVDISLNDYRDVWYPNDKKVVPIDISLTSLVCKYWFYSDGYTSYLNENCVILGLCTNSFTKKECLWLRRKLESLGFEFNIAKKVKGHILQARKKESVNGFLQYVGLPDLDCFEYKWKEHTGLRPCRGY